MSRPAFGLLWHQLYDDMEIIRDHSITTNFDGKMGSGILLIEECLSTILLFSHFKVFE
jgi:hypothetical protein